MHTRSSSTSRIQLNSRLVPAVVGLLLLLQLAFPYRGWLLLLVGFGGLWLIGYLWARSLATGLKLRREMRYGWSQVGDRLEERFTLTNRGWAPGMWVEVVDHTDMPAYNVGRVTGVGAADSIHWQTSGICSQRGLFTLGPTTLRSGDPFSLYTVSIHVSDSRTLLVTPPVVPLPQIEVAPAGRTGEGPPRSNAVEPSISASTVREYVPGDTTRWIHWRTSARRGQLYVRLFEDTPASDWWIFLDVDADVQVGSGQGSTEEHAVILAASLADRGLRGNRNVGLVAHGEHLVWIPPASGEGQRLRILRELAVLSPGRQPLAALLERMRPALGKHASLVVVTPSPDRTWIEALILLMRRGAKPTVLLLDPASFGGTGNVSAIRALLTSLGVAAHVITQDMLDRPEARPGEKGRWEWRTLGTGRVVPVRQPEDTSWRPL